MTGGFNPPLFKFNILWFIFLWYNKVIGVLAQLIRALRWQRRGQEFESPILHQIVFKTHRYGEFFYFHCGYLAFTLFFCVTL